MKRNMSRNIAAASVLLAAAWAGSKAEAAQQLILDLRVAGTSGDSAVHTATVSNVGDVVTMDIVALMQGNSATTSQNLQLLATALRTPGALKGNLNVTLDNTWAQDPVGSNNGGIGFGTGSTSASHPNIYSDWDSDSDIEPGANNTNTTVGNFLNFSSSSTLTTTSTETISGVTYAAFHLGTVTFTAASNAQGTSTCVLAMFMKGSGLTKPQKVGFDSTTTSASLFGTDSRLKVGTGGTAGAASGTPMTISVASSGPATPYISLTTAGGATETLDLGTAGVSGSNGNYIVTSVDDPNPDQVAGKVAVNDIGNEAGTFIAGIKLSGTGDLSALIASLSANSAGWTISQPAGGLIAGLPGNGWTLKATIANPTGAGANDILNLNLGTTGFKVDQVAAIPEPSTLGLIGLGTVLAAHRRRRSA